MSGVPTDIISQATARHFVGVLLLIDNPTRRSKVRGAPSKSDRTVLHHLLCDTRKERSVHWRMMEDNDHIPDGYCSDDDRRGDPASQSCDDQRFQHIFFSMTYHVVLKCRE